jgi:hypothetical protein
MEGLGMENVALYSGHFEYFMTIGYIYWAFGNFVVIWYIFPRFGILYQEKSGNPALHDKFRLKPEKIMDHGSPSLISSTVIKAEIDLKKMS